MRALKLVQLMKTNSAVMSDELVRKVRASGKCNSYYSESPRVNNGNMQVRFIKP